MALLTYPVGLFQPADEFRIDLVGRFETKPMQDVARRESLDPAEARTADTTGEDQMPVKPTLAWHQRSKAHSNLQSDAGLLRQHCHRANRLQRFHNGVVRRAHPRISIDKMAFESLEGRAGVGLIWVGE